MKRQSGIMSFFSSLGASVLLMALAVICTMVYGISVQSRLQEQFITRTAAVDAILADLYEMERAFGVFSREWTEAGFGTYGETCEKLTGDLEEYREYCQDAPATLNYIRRLNNFNVYQQEQIRKAMDGADFKNVSRWMFLISGAFAVAALIYFC